MAGKKNFIILSIFVTTLIWVGAFAQPDHKVHIWSIGGKDYLSLLIKSETGQLSVVNPQPNSDFLEKIGQHIPFFQRELDLVIVTSNNETSKKGLDELVKRYRVHSVWSASEDSGRLLSGIQSSNWQNLQIQTFAAPDHDILVELSSGAGKLLLAGKPDSLFWQSLPLDQEDLLIGPVVGKKGWQGQDLESKVTPASVVTNKDVRDPHFLTAGEVEIVWDKDTWYIGKSR